jgi:hypothetical protein
MSKKYIKADLNAEESEKLFNEITGIEILPNGEMYTIDAFFARDENGYISLYYYDSAQRQEIINKKNNESSNA